ncbi:MAG: D-alanyl-D-alanine carboxypeptidase family protein [Candidatus Woesearchaeota archaeon]|nr:D-alanyl-D-alanine carboxypeptidase family protein [Candidatus Woesearchaeota archaeon]
MKIISDEKLIKVQMRDNSEKFVNLRKFCPGIMVRLELESRALQHLKKDECYVRKTVAIKLCHAQKTLQKGLKLMVLDGYRSIEAQRKMHKHFCRQLKRRHPGWNRKKILSFADLFVANPDKITLHSTGGTIDITICDSKGRQLDMGSEIYLFPENLINVPEKISTTARRNRALLRRCLQKQGFVNYSLEWWHWSYGDAYWAVALKKRHAIYAPVSAEKVLGKRRT